MRHERNVWIIIFWICMILAHLSWWFEFDLGLIVFTLSAVVSQGVISVIRSIERK